AGHIWTFPGGIHPPERKDRSNTTPIRVLPLAKHFVVPVKQHSGPVGDLLVSVGDTVKAGQPLTQVGANNGLPVHAPTSGTVTAIGPGRIAHPSGLTDTVITIAADGNDEFYSLAPLADYATVSRAELLERIRLAG